MNKTDISDISEQSLDEMKKEDIIEDDKLVEYIFNLENSVGACLKALCRYFRLHGEETIEIISRLTGMYQFSGSKILEKLLTTIVIDSDVSSFLKLETTKSLIGFEVDLENIEESDDQLLKDSKSESNSVIIEKNKRRKDNAYRCLNRVCAKFDDKIATPCKIESVCLLMECVEYKEESNVYFKGIIDDVSIDCNFRYKTILSIESENKWKIEDRQFFLKEAMMCFVNQTKNLIMYRILACQYLLQKIKLSPIEYQYTENILLSFAEDSNVEYNLRADASDTLLSLGSSKEIKLKARDIINLLGNLFGKATTIFENAQNVHSQEIEESITEALGQLSTLSLAVIADTKEPITFDYVRTSIEKMLIDEKKTLDKQICDHKCSHEKCVYCGSCIDDFSYSKEHKNGCCGIKCHEKVDKYEKIKLSLNRIDVDRILYSKYSQTLSNILLKVWTYASTHEYKDTIMLRLLEELYDMSGTCSSGFASRLINTVSGFGDFNIRISWEDQIIANFAGRLNAQIIKITDSSSVYFGKKHREVVELYLRHLKIIKKRKDAHELENRDTIDSVIDSYLMEGKEQKLSDAVDYFYESVISEMTIPVEYYYLRQNFLKFFRDSMLYIREQLYEEFKEFITDSEFDLYIRKAICHYEGF